MASRTPPPRPRAARSSIDAATPAAKRPRAARAATPAPASAGERARAAPRSRADRQKVQSDQRRAHVLDAARAAFFELGLEGASVRAIAQRAGYTPGAIYSYFPSKEAVYAALLGESLARLNGCVAQAAQGAEGSPGDTPAVLAERLRATATAFYDFYADNPRDLDLGFYLFQGMQPRGLTPELDEQLNTQLRAALAPQQACLQALGLDHAQAVAEITALFAHVVGLLVLSHTGRIRMFKLQSRALFDAYLAQLLARAGARNVIPPER